MKIGSLFSGIGGLDLGLERGLAEFGAETVWQIENDEYCCSVLEKNFPNSKVICDDIRNVDFSKLEPVDILVGGFPCQTFSYAGARRGMSEEDDRGLLWYEFERAISVLKPRWVVGENVRGLLTAKDSEGNKGGAFARVISFLSSRGYSVEWQVISAASVGSSHLRERIFIVGNTEHYGPFGTENRESIGKRPISRRQTEEILEKINRQLERKSEVVEHTESVTGIKADKQTSTKREKGETWVDSGTGHGRTKPFISWEKTKQQVGFFTYGLSKGLAGKVGLPAYWLYTSDIEGTLWATPTATQIERSNLQVSDDNPNRFVHKDGKTYPMNLTEQVKTREEKYWRTPTLMDAKEDALKHATKLMQGKTHRASGQPIQISLADQIAQDMIAENPELFEVYKNDIMRKRTKLPEQKEFVDYLRSVTTIQDLTDNTDIPKSTIEHWFRYDKSGFSYPSIEHWEQITPYLVPLKFNDELTFTEIIEWVGESGPTESDYAIQPWEIVPRTAEDEVDRVNKIKALGNAVVPACAELVGRLISKSINEETVVFDQNLLKE